MRKNISKSRALRAPPAQTVPGLTYRRDHDQPHQEADHTDEQQQQLSALASADQVRVQVSHRRHQGLQTHKLGDGGEAGSDLKPPRGIHQSACVCVGVYLGVQPQHDDHEEEADGPELGERHHGYSPRVGNEGQARP